MVINETIKFEDVYKTMKEKISFLKEFDLLNLQKAGKIGNISIKKMEKKESSNKSHFKFWF